MTTFGKVLQAMGWPRPNAAVEMPAALAALARSTPTARSSAGTCGRRWESCGSERSPRRWLTRRR